MRPPFFGVKAMPRKWIFSSGASSVSITKCRNTVRSTTSSSTLANAAPMQRRVPPPNGTQAVGVLKARHGLPPSDPARESVQIARLERLAEDADLDPEFARKFLNFIISEVIRHHESHLESGPAPITHTQGD